MHIHTPTGSRDSQVREVTSKEKNTFYGGLDSVEYKDKSGGKMGFMASFCLRQSKRKCSKISFGTLNA
jgi:hypothetical protein